MSSKHRVLRPTILQPDDLTIRHIALTQGQIAIVDASDYEWLTRSNWYAAWMPKAKTFYARRYSKEHGRLLGMHRAILNLPDCLDPDHIDGDTLNNRRGNLRPATLSQNNSNRGIPANNTSGFKGVYALRGRWVAKITIDRKLKHIGTFDLPEDAARAYDTAAVMHFGEFANLHFPLLAVA